MRIVAVSLLALTLVVGSVRATEDENTNYRLFHPVADEGFKAADGAWGNTKLEAKFDEITHAQLTARGRKNQHYWTFSRRSAEDVKLSIGNVVMEQAAVEIAARLKARGIETKDDPGGP